jgi:hypothetical protein
MTTPTSKLKVLVACEYSGRVREAFRALGHTAVSCDLLPAEDGSPHHYQGDVFELLSEGVRWDLMIGHPPCTFMSNSGAKHLYLDGKMENGRDEARWHSMEEAADFFLKLWNAPVPKIALENPIMVGHAKKLIGVQQTQIIQPWQHGHGETKATCLWLKGLPKLVPTNVVDGRKPVCHFTSPGPNRWKERSRTYQGIANAMASQWG